MLNKHRKNEIKHSWSLWNRIQVTNTTWSKYLRRISGWKETSGIWCKPFHQTPFLHSLFTDFEKGKIKYKNDKYQCNQTVWKLCASFIELRQNYALGLFTSTAHQRIVIFSSIHPAWRRCVRTFPVIY